MKTITDLEYKKFNEAGAVKTISNAQALIIDDYTTTNITYFGYAQPGSNTGSANWSIKVIDETGNYPIFKYADGNSDYDNIWDNRVGLTYT